MSRDDYEAELSAGREEIASILSGVAEGIRTGAVRLGDSPDAVTVDTPDELTMEIELETEDDEISLELELEWTVSSEASPVSSLDVTPEGEDEEVELLGATDGAQSLARFEVYRARDAEWRWRLRHQNGNIIASSGEGYTRKHNALKGLRSVIANSADAAISEETC
ncbi:amphi-Trp domain-containing protein [Haloferax prahovense]|uniref:amphi-Trp domain-containing protein n=1 Tax=Haloferax prahovense TaxID=381852 RepID=UPI003C745F2B